MKSIKASLVALVCFAVMQFTSSQEFRKIATKIDPSKRKLVVKGEGRRVECADGVDQGSSYNGKAGGKAAGKAGGKAGGTVASSSYGKAGGKAGGIAASSSYEKAGGKAGGKSGNNDRRLPYASVDQGKAGGKAGGKGKSGGGKSGGKGNSYSSEPGKGIILSSVQGKGTSSSSGPAKGSSSVTGKDSGGVEKCIEPVNPQPNTQFKLNIVKGSGSGEYTPGREVTIVAKQGPSGSTFLEWNIIDGPGGIISNMKSKTATLTMPNQATRVKAIFSSDQHDLEVIRGSGDGKYPSGEVVNIRAESPFTGAQFIKWNVVEGPKDIISDASSQKTTMTMPNQAARVEAIFSSPEYNLKVIGGSGSGTYPFSEEVQIEANSLGGTFLQWNIIKGPSGIIGDISSKSTTLTMPNQDVRVEAIYVYKLEVRSGSGDGDYSEGEEVTIRADSDSGGGSFSRWTVIGGSSDIIDDINSETSFITMPANNAIVQAEYSSEPSPGKTFNLEVRSGDGDGDYSEGKTVTIRADSASGGGSFLRWTVISGPSGIIADINSETSFITMPAEDVVVEADYSSQPNPGRNYELIVRNGDGDGRYKAGSVVDISANLLSNNQNPQSFSNWMLVEGDGQINNFNAKQTTVTMPAGDVIVRAIYVNTPPTKAPATGPPPTPKPTRPRSNTESDP